MLADPRSRALVDNFAMQWLKLGKVAGVVPDVDAFPEFDENLRERHSGRRRARSSAASCATTARVAGAVDGQLHASSTSGSRATTDSRRVRQPLPARDVRRRRARRAARARRSMLTVTSYPNRTSPVLRGKMAARQRARLAAAAAAARRALARAKAADRARLIHPRADGGAPQEPGVRHLPRAHGSARLLARELRRARAVAHGHDAGPDRRVGDAARRHARSTASRGLRALLAGHRDDFVRTFTEKLLTYALGRGVETGRHAGRARDRARRGRRRVPLVVDHRGHRREHAVPMASASAAGDTRQQAAESRPSPERATP